MKLYISHMYSLTTFKVFPKGIQKKVNYVSLRVVIEQTVTKNKTLNVLTNENIDNLGGSYTIINQLA